LHISFSSVFPPTYGTGFNLVPSPMARSEYSFLFFMRSDPTLLPSCFCFHRIPTCLSSHTKSSVETDANCCLFASICLDALWACRDLSRSFLYYFAFLRPRCGLFLRKLRESGGAGARCAETADCNLRIPPWRPWTGFWCVRREFSRNF